MQHGNLGEHYTNALVAVALEEGYAEFRDVVADADRNGLHASY